ncbi:MAG: hypothetical protein HZB39_19275 [Planctomycetes bacterium]|nr:hypothetical protein [Planctomycetota bacterium]
MTRDRETPGTGAARSDRSALALLLAVVIFAAAGVASRQALAGERSAATTAATCSPVNRAIAARAGEDAQSRPSTSIARIVATDRPRWRDVAARGLPAARAPTRRGA